MTTPTKADWDRWQATLAKQTEMTRRCLVIPGSKRTCEHGTAGCGIAHTPLPLIDLDDQRAALVRVVVSQQWREAISFWWDEARGLGLDVDHPDDPWGDEEYAAAAAIAAKNMRGARMVRHFARFPCAADVIADLLGEP